ncbi:MAG TPA: helix-turn-helix domain-containing protein [Streptosporangiaceae bacterium]|nr:helix-turn-helix domain-containing protein [Streptosporangiaceae bacterium]
MRSAPAIPERLFASVPEVAEILGSDPRTVRRALEAGQIPGTKVGAFWKIPTAWLLKQARRGGDNAA